MKEVMGTNLGCPFGICLELGMSHEKLCKTLVGTISFWVS